MFGKKSKPETKKCRGCGRKVQRCAIDYGKDCLCRACLDKYLPYALRK